jgi:hypothetical protein
MNCSVAISHWNRHFTTFLRTHPAAMRASAPYGRRPPTLSQRRHIIAAVHLVESFDTEGC